VSVVATDGMVTDGPDTAIKEHIGVFAIVDVPSREEALEWAAKIAVACRWAQEVRELLPDPTGLIEFSPRPTPRPNADFDRPCRKDRFSFDIWMAENPSHPRRVNCNERRQTCAC
jgi:hypothetical protein